MKQILKSGITSTIACLALALPASFLLSKELLLSIFYSLLQQDYPEAFYALGRAIFPLFVVYGNLVYLLTRFGHQRRKQMHRPAREEDIIRFLSHDHKADHALTILVPSYKEEIPVIRQSLLSSALQDFPNRRIVLLIDDPSNPSNLSDIEALRKARRLPEEIKEMFERPHRTFEKASVEFEKRKEKGPLDLDREKAILSGLLFDAAAWFETQAENYPIRDHTDATFVELTFKKRADDLQTRGASFLRDSSDANRMEMEYNRLRWMFNVQISSFERKKYCNLSHAPNKAMNLNSYIGLMGKEHREFEKGGELYLVPSESQEKADLIVPSTPYVAMLDADSVLTYDYAMRLIYEMEKKENEKIAVMQTPYSAFPNASNELERIAGATTDMQYNIHQGFTFFGATFWVGANAIARKEALDQIAEPSIERGHPIIRFIQDRTVIEDTESSVDLIEKGWTLSNYPERMSYSATPPDFGSLLIQRRRWANGGLLIIPKLLRYFFRRPERFVETFFRFHYLASIPGILLGLAAASFLPLESTYSLLLFALASIPYFLIYSRDLKIAGYRYSDIVKVMALNILLIPVNLGGVLKSLEQAVTGKHIPFCRTPKVEGMTFVPALYFAAEGLMLAISLLFVSMDLKVMNLNSLIKDFLFFLPLLYASTVFLRPVLTFKSYRNGKVIEKEERSTQLPLTASVSSISHRI